MRPIGDRIRDLPTSCATACRVSELMWENTVEDNMAHAHVRLDNYGNNHLLKICKIVCFHTMKIVMGTRLNFTLYVHCLVSSF